MNEYAQNTKAAPALAVHELFHTAPRTMSAIFAVVAAAVVTTGISQLF
jgi:hypothetical protein